MMMGMDEDLIELGRWLEMVQNRNGIDWLMVEWIDRESLFFVGVHPRINKVEEVIAKLPTNPGWLQEISLGDGNAWEMA